MYQLVKRCYIYGILIVHEIETKIHTYAIFKEYFQIVYSTNAMLYHTNKQCNWQ